MHKSQNRSCAYKEQVKPEIFVRIPCLTKAALMTTNLISCMTCIVPRGNALINSFNWLIALDRLVSRQHVVCLQMFLNVGKPKALGKLGSAQPKNSKSCRLVIVRLTPSLGCLAPWPQMAPATLQRSMRPCSLSHPEHFGWSTCNDSSLSRIRSLSWELNTLHEPRLKSSRDSYYPQARHPPALAV